MVLFSHFLLRGKEHYNKRHIWGIAISLLIVAMGDALYICSLPEPLKVKQVSSYEIYKYRRENDRPTPLQSDALELRESLIGRYKQYVSAENIGILSALTLGQKEYLEKDVKQAFSVSGGSHVLAVSGLHVGIIYSVFLLLTSFLPRKRLFTIIRHSLIIIALWGYATLCGLPASVVRSAFMLTIVSFGFIIGRNQISLNSVFVSAFFMLLYNPLYLFDIGFQLSYSAVVSILVLYPKFYALLEYKNKILIWLWGMVCVSAAAQIGTTPLTIYYFHQLPTYSLLTNFVVVPSAFIIIHIAIFLLLSTSAASLAAWFGGACDYVITTMKNSIESIVNLPYSAIYNLHPKLSVIILFYFMLTFVAFFLYCRDIRYIRLPLYALIGYQIFDLATIIYPIFY